MRKILWFLKFLLNLASYAIGLAAYLGIDHIKQDLEVDQQTP